MADVPAKDDLRARFRAYRRGLSAEAWAGQSAAIARRASGLPEVERARRVLAYWPQEAEREADPRPLIDALLARGAEVALPVVTGFTRATPTMEARRYDGAAAAAALVPNRWGLMEPTGGARVDATALDLVLVPALGAGRDGHRVGHGFGYYDAFLAPLRDVPRVVLAYDACLVDRVPAEAHDVPATAVVTETAVLRP
jgi:5-formyltetrahydrofolate cyclo-ligase